MSEGVFDRVFAKVFDRDSGGVPDRRFDQVSVRTDGAPAVATCLLPVDASGNVQDLRGLEAHTAAYGSMPTIPRAADGRPGALVDEIHAAGLRGRGGGWFPTARKIHAVVESAAARRALSSGRKPVVIANAMEGEPASGKDAVLISHSPHLVLDGLQAAALTIGATSAFIAVHRGSPLIDVLDAAIAERRGTDQVKVELVTPPARYVASEETALTHWIGDGTATPVFGGRPFQRGVDGRPTLVQNAETLAHIALIARHGGAWFEAVGDPQAPGTALVTVGGAVGRAGVIEVPTGTPVTEILRRCGGLADGVAGFLTGGYGGAWAKPEEIMAASWTPDSVQHAGGVIGAGILVALSKDTCALTEMVNVASWMAGESAGQCGPCRFGLPSVADDLSVLESATASTEDLHRLESRLGLVVGRGGCKHPDGTARFVSTGLHTFHEEVAHHLNGRCTGKGSDDTTRQRRATLPTPDRREAPVSAPGKDFR